MDKSTLHPLLVRHRVFLIFLSHSVLGVSAYLFAFLLRFEFSPPAEVLAIIEGTVLPVLAIKMLSLRYFDLHKGLWRYVSVRDLAQILKACTLSTILLVLWVVFFRNTPLLKVNYFPRSIYVLDWIMSIMLYGGIRFGIRMFREILQDSDAQLNGRRALIIGAGDRGEMALRALQRSPQREVFPIGFLDDDPAKAGVTLHGLPVLGTLADAPRLIQQHQVSLAIIAIPATSKKVLRQLFERCANLKVHFQILPPLEDVSGQPDKVHRNRIRDVRVEDLLGRDPIHLDPAPVAASLGGQCVMVTGAGGSIGSELARQIASFKPRTLVLLDVGETPLFEIDRELRERYPELPLVPVFCNIQHAADVEAAIVTYKPDLIYHAAAYKHVPLMEGHPVHAVLNNVGGTHNLARAAIRHNVKRFLMISTDKAVAPKSVMGSTKRCAELLLKFLGGHGTEFVAVRFGNVLGSNGSVVPIFQKQIERGGPITITHPEITRYFMTIPEAVELVLHASSIGHDGDLFMLEMGDPVKIADLARNMVELAGLTVGEDIEIRFTGLRPGEKLHEELAYQHEAVTPTAVPKLLLHQEATRPPSHIRGCIAELEHAAITGDQKEVYDLLRRIVTGADDAVPAVKEELPD